MSVKHPQVRIEHRGASADVDEGIAPLVLALWRRGYRTNGSCEAYQMDGVAYGAYVGFPDAEQAETFRQVVGAEAQVMVVSPEDEAEAVRLGWEVVAAGTVGVFFPSEPHRLRLVL